MNTKQKAETQYKRWLAVAESVVGSGETTLSQLTTGGKKMFGDKYVGTFASDKIPMLSDDQVAIVNVDRTGQPGSHWIGWTKTLVYDSFGRKVKSLLTADNIPMDTADDAEQSVTESNCGARCLAFLSVYLLHGHNAAVHI